MGFSSIPAATLGQVALVSQVGGAANSALGSIYSASSQRSSLAFQSRMAGINAQIAENGAQTEMLRGEQQVAGITAKAGQVKSGQRAAMAANGVDLGVGNAAEVQATTDLVKEIDSNTAKANAVRSAWGYRTQASNYQTEAAMKRSASDSISPGMALTSSLLTSAGAVAGTWYNYQRNQAGGR